VSELSWKQGSRRRRADAERSIAIILDTAVRVLNERPEASVGEIAKEAGVTRPTVYAHYPSREALLNAAIDHITQQAVAAIDAVDLDHGPPTAALRRYLAAGWQILQRYPLLLRTPTMRLDPVTTSDRHQPIHERLERLVKRGQDAGDFDASLPPRWLAAVIIGLGHTAGEHVAAGHLSLEAAKTVLEHTTLRTLGFRRPTD
jgi:AcrR family transcriptional regulator